MEAVYTRRTGNIKIVDYLNRCGLNVMPLRLDGSKAPRIKWLRYQLEDVPYEIIRRYFDMNRRGPSGIGVICGVTSGFLEILDFDGPHLFEPWCQGAVSILGDVLGDIPVVRTPKGGYHLYYRCEAVGANTKLALDAERRVQIETRGQGGQAVMPGSPGRCHPSGRTYDLISGDFADIPVISAGLRSRLFALARSFDLAPPPAKSREERLREICGEENIGQAKDRPGDDYNARGPSWDEILIPHGWAIVGVAGGVTYWQRPDKVGTGISATTGRCGDLLYVFSSNAAPFEANHAYSKYAAYTILEHDQDWSRAASSLVELGYGRGVLTRSEEEVHRFFNEVYG